MTTPLICFRAPHLRPDSSCRDRMAPLPMMPCPSQQLPYYHLIRRSRSSVPGMTVSTGGDSTGTTFVLGWCLVRCFVPEPAGACYLFPFSDVMSAQEIGLDTERDMGVIPRFFFPPTLDFKSSNTPTHILPNVNQEQTSAVRPIMRKCYSPHQTNSAPAPQAQSQAGRTQNRPHEQTAVVQRACEAPRGPRRSSLAWALVSLVLAQVALVGLAWRPTGGREVICQ